MEDNLTTDHVDKASRPETREQQQKVSATEEVVHQYHQEQDEDEEEEAVSLSGLILNSDEVEFQDRRRSSSADLSEFFEFFSDGNYEMSHAEDIIFAGKLIPYRGRPHQISLSKSDRFLTHPTENERQKSFISRRSESLNDLKTTRTISVREHHQLMRNSRYLDYQKLYGKPSSIRWSGKSETTRSSSTKSCGATVSSVHRPSRWYMIFGLGKFPPEMDFQDMKSRQAARRNSIPSTLYTTVEIAGGDGKAIVNRVGHRRCSSSNWDLIRVLSCKDHASVAVTSPFGRLQEI